MLKDGGTYTYRYSTTYLTYIKTIGTLPKVNNNAGRKAG